MFYALINNLFNLLQDDGVFVVLLLVLGWWWCSVIQGCTTHDDDEVCFNVMDYGAINDGRTDSSHVILFNYIFRLN